MTQFNNTYNLNDDKLILLAQWPGEDFEPEIWSRSDIATDFDNNTDVLSLVDALGVGDSLHHEDSNLLLTRVPSFLSFNNIKTRSNSSDSTDDDADDDFV